MQKKSSKTVHTKYVAGFSLKNKLNLGLTLCCCSPLGHFQAIHAQGMLLFGAKHIQGMLLFEARHTQGMLLFAQAVREARQAQ